MKSKLLLGIIVFLLMLVFVSSYTADSYDAVQSTLETSYTADPYDAVKSVLGEVEGTPSTNFTMWDGSKWISVGDPELPEFRCLETQKNCEPTNQDAGSSQSIFQVCNNGTLEGSKVDMNINYTVTGIDIFCDDDYTSSDGINLTSSNQSIHGSLAIDACVNISCWANYSNPTSGFYFDIWAYVISS